MQYNPALATLVKNPRPQIFHKAIDVRISARRLLMIIVSTGRHRLSGLEARRLLGFFALNSAFLEEFEARGDGRGGLIAFYWRLNSSFESIGLLSPSSAFPSNWRNWRNPD